MSGLVKAKKYDWQDSNLALFGSDTEKSVKKDSAETEPAWNGAGAAVGLQIWRIVKFKVTHQSKEDYGKFYSGDSYIILNTYNPSPESDELNYDVHFWIGQHSTQDEYGTAAYKTVELDTFLDDKAVQHREVQAHESTLFKSYFKSMTVMQGGADTGFRHVTPEEYKARLLHFHGKGANVTLTEVPRSKSRLNSDDVFILDLGLIIYQLNGANANKNEKYNAAQHLQTLKSERGKAKVEVLDEDDISTFLDHLGDDDEEDEDEEEDQPDQPDVKRLYRVSDASGEIAYDQVKEGDISLDDFSANDVFILTTGDAMFVWIGRRASGDEKKNGVTYAHTVANQSSNPLAPITVIKQGQDNKDFHKAIAA